MRKTVRAIPGILVAGAFQYTRAGGKQLYAWKNVKIGVYGKELQLLDKLECHGQICGYEMEAAWHHGEAGLEVGYQIDFAIDNQSKEFILSPIQKMGRRLFGRL